MSKEVRYSDPNEALIAYREQFGFDPLPRQQREIVTTVKTYDDWIVFTSLLANWGYFRNGEWHPRDPRDVSGMIRCFFFKRRERQCPNLKS